MRGGSASGPPARPSLVLCARPAGRLKHADGSSRHIRGARTTTSFFRMWADTICCTVPSGGWTFRLPQTATCHQSINQSINSGLGGDGSTRQVEGIARPFDYSLAECVRGKPSGDADHARKICTDQTA